MEMKIQLPCPDSTSAEQWFAQMRIALKAAEKMYQESVKNLTEEEKADESSLPWIRFTLDHELVDNILKGEASEEGIDEWIQSSIYIQVGQL
jgi:predicted aldo/keto reductase-like oxidoreductase